jgi:hypothetical protein
VFSRLSSPPPIPAKSKMETPDGEINLTSKSAR